VNRIQQFRNIDLTENRPRLRERGSHGGPLAAAPRIADEVFFHFPSEKGGFYRDRLYFSFTREQNNFHIFYDFYQRSLRGGFPGRGIFGC